jgi:hypothetical protein
MKRLSKDEILEEIMAVKIENDFMNNGHPDSRDPKHRWNGTTGHEAKPLWTPEALQALHDSAPKPKPTFAERMAARAAAKKVQ